MINQGYEHWDLDKVCRIILNMFLTSNIIPSIYVVNQIIALVHSCYTWYVTTIFGLVLIIIASKHLQGRLQEIIFLSQISLFSHISYSVEESWCWCTFVVLTIFDSKQNILRMFVAQVVDKQVKLKIIQNMNNGDLFLLFQPNIFW